MSGILELIKLREELDELKGENATLRLNAIPTRMHSDEAWRKRVAALKTENERLRKELAILEAQYQRLEATAERFTDIITKQALAPEQPPSGSKP